MKKILILLLTICSLVSYGQVLQDPSTTPSTARTNEAISTAYPTSGTDTYSISPLGSFSYTYLTGKAVSVTFGNVNTGASTLNFDGLGVKNILKWSSGSLVAVAAGDLIGTIRLRYDGTQFVMEGGSGSGSGTIDGSGTTNELPYWVDSNTLGSLAVATYPSLTELSYGKGVTSALQTQLNSKAPSTSGSSVLKGNGSGGFSTALNSDLPAMTATVGGAVPTPPNNTTTFLRGDGTFATPSGSGDVVGPASSIDNGVVTYDGTTGKLIKSMSARLIINGTNGIKGHYLGYNAGTIGTFSVSDGQNTTYGSEAGQSLTDGLNSYNSSYHTLIGYRAGRNYTTGSHNTVVGTRAGEDGTTGFYNTIVGSYAYRIATTGNSNVFVGYISGQNSTASEVTAVGFNTGGQTTGANNRGVFVGWGAGAKNTSGQYNVFIGAEAGQETTTTSQNVYIGQNSGVYNQGSSNLFAGFYSGHSIVTLGVINESVMLGQNSGVTNVSANATVNATGLTFVGAQTGYGSTTQNIYGTAIGYRANITSDYEFALGSYTSTYKPNWGFGGSGFGSGRGVLFFKDSDTAPTGDPTSGFWLYSTAGNEFHKSPQASFIGDYTGASDVTPLHAFTINKNVTQTGSATNKVASIARITGTITGAGGGGTQELNALLIDPTFNTSLGSRNFYIHAKSSTGGSAFQVREETEDSRNTIMKVLGGTSSATEASMQVATNTTYWTTTGPTNIFTNTSSSASAVHNFSMNNVTLGGFSNQTTNLLGRGFNVYQITAGTPTSTATQIGSAGISWNGAFYTGATSLAPAGFYSQLIASTSVNRLGFWRLRENISSVDPGDILSVEGGSEFGLGIGVSDPSARLHLVAGTATANTAPIKLTTGTALTTPENGSIEYHSSHLWFTDGGVRYQIDQQATAGVSRVLNSNITTTGNVGTGEDVLYTYTVPAGQLTSDKDQLVANFSGRIGASGANKTIKIKFGGEILFNTGAVADASGSDWTAEVRVYRTGAATQKAIVKFQSTNAAITSTVDYTTPAQTLSGTVVFEVTGEATSNNEVLFEMGEVSYLPHE